MTYAKLTDSNTITYPPATIVRPDGTTVIGYNRNESLLIEDGWMQVIEDARPAEPASPVYSIEDGHIRVAWELLPPPPPPAKGRLGHVIRLRHFPGLGEVALFQSSCDLPRKKWPLGVEFFRMTASLPLPVDTIRKNDIYALRYEGVSLELGRVLDLQGHTLPASDCDWHERYTPLLQTRLECLKAEDWESIGKSLDLLSRMDPSFRVSLDPERGCWVLYTVGEVQLEVLLARLSREFGCEVKAGEPEVQWHERLLRPLGPIVNTFQAGPFAVSVELSLYPLPGEQSRCALEGPPGLENQPVDLLAAVRSALLEAAEAGIRGKGELLGVGFVLHRLDCGEAPLPMVKKACADAVRLLVTPADVALYEPYMQLELECPAQYAGNVTGDLQSREGRIKEVGGDGKFHSLVAEIPLRRIFGYSTLVRSISRGTACYTLRYAGHRLAKEA